MKTPDPEPRQRDFLQENQPKIVLKRAGKPEESAWVVFFLAFEAASFIPGPKFRLHGGSVTSI